MKKLIRAVSILVLVSVGFFSLSIIWTKNRYFPYEFVEHVYHTFTVDESYLQGTWAEQLQNDLGFFPYRHAQVTDYAPPADRRYVSVDIPGLKDDRDPPQVFIDPARPKRLTLLLGAIDTKDALHSAVLLGPDGRLIHRFPISFAYAGVRDYGIQPDGMLALPDGSIVTAVNSGDRMTRFGPCGEVIWEVPGHHHHSVMPDGEGNLWAWNDITLEKLRISDGKVMKSFNARDILDANPEIDIFGIRQRDYWAGAEWEPDPLHPNDLEPLPAAKAAAFPMFKPGDLLISYRSENLFFVLDPDTFKVKWWRMGLGRRAHDPDWNDDGTISFYDNNMDRGPAYIRAVDPATYQVTTLLDGAKYDFHGRILGRHEIHPDGSMLVTVAYQGRAFEVDADGKVIFEYINNFRNSDHRVGVLTDAQALPLDFYDKELPTCE